jgi:hypothetical protein
MSYAVSSALQSAVYDALISDPALNGLLGSAVFDALPTGNVPETYVSLGDERVQDASDQSGDGALHRLDIYVRTSLPGFATAKAAATAVSDVLQNANLPLTRGRLVYLRFDRAEARRVGTNATREILLRFRARVEDQ